MKLSLIYYTTNNYWTSDFCKTGYKPPPITGRLWKQGIKLIAQVLQAYPTIGPEVLLMKYLPLFILPTLLLSGCSSLGNNPPIDFLVGSPQKHGFVVFEGETALRGVDVQAVALENTQYPETIIHGMSQMKTTWFSNLEPGNYRIKQIRLIGEKGEFTKIISDNEIADDPRLTFSIKAGELFYLGLIEIQMSELVTIRNRSGQIVRYNSRYIRSNIIDNHDEFRVWETLYDEYSTTPWEPLLLKKLDEQKIKYPDTTQSNSFFIRGSG